MTSQCRLGKKLMQRSDDAKKYEKDVRSFSYALSLSRNQNYEVASIKEVRTILLFEFITNGNKQTEFFNFRFGAN